MYLTYFLKILWVDKNWNMGNIRTESPIDTNFSVQYGDNSNFDGSEKNYLDIFIYIYGSKVYPRESSFIFHSKNVAVNNFNDLRLISNRLYISTKRVDIKVPPVGYHPSRNKIISFYSCYNVGNQHTKYYRNPCMGRFGTPPFQNKIILIKRLVSKMHFMSRVFSDTTSLMTSVCMQYVGAMATRPYLS